MKKQEYLILSSRESVIVSLLRIIATCTTELRNGSILIYNRALKLSIIEKSRFEWEKETKICPLFLRKDAFIFMLFMVG